MNGLVRMWTGAATVLVAVALATMVSTRAEAACQGTPYLGEICTFAFGKCPTGFVPADGRLLPISSNLALFSLLGTNFGGDGISNFAVPDLRGATVVGVGQAPSGPNIGLGQTGGDANTVSVLAADAPDGVLVPQTRLPTLGLSQCIATNGFFPPRQ